jgi:hypothetical protein
VSGSGFDGIVITGNVVHDCTGNATTYQGCGITLQSLNTYGLAAVPPTVINAYVGNNTVYNCIGKSKAIINSHSGNGILLGQAKDSLIAYNYVHHNGGSGGSLVGIWIYDCEAVTLQYNESAFHTVEAGTSDGGGFDLDGGCKDCVVQYNYSHDNVGAGYLLYNYEDGATYGQYPLQGNIIRFNITENDGGASGVSVGKASITIGNDETGRDHTGNKIYNNVIMTSLSGGVAVNFIGAAHNLIKSTYFANNIIRVTGSSGVLIYTYNVTPDTTFKFVGNLYYTTATFSLKWGATTYSSLGTWRAAFVTQETVSGGNTSVSGDPLFVGSVPVGTIGGFNAAALGAYKLQSSSPAKNAGQDLATLYSINLGTIDLFGNPLSAGGVANIGCYEAS